MSALRSLDLFSCVGCHALGFQRAGIATVEFCEIDPFRRRILGKHFPEIPIHDDIRTFSPKFWRPDICIGGPPCQATSVAAAIHGHRTGESLWPDMRRVILRAEPHFVVVEQPPGHAAWEAKVASDLCKDGFYIARFEFGACDVGAPYLRRRVFLVACPSLSRLEIAGEALPSAVERAKGAANARGDWNPADIPHFGMDSWRAERVDERHLRIEALGDSNPPAMAEAVGYMLIAAMS